MGWTRDDERAAEKEWRGFRRADEARQMRKERRTPLPGDEATRQRITRDAFHDEARELLRRHVGAGLDAERAADSLRLLADEAHTLRRDPSSRAAHWAEQARQKAADHEPQHDQERDR